MTFPRIVLLLCLAIGARAAHPRSPENCFCETWSLGNALGALGGSQNGADFRPGTSYTGGKKVTSAGNNCVSWMQVSPTPATRPNVPCRTPIPPNPDPRLTNGGQSTRDSRENQPLFPAGVPSLTSPLTSPRLALNAPSSTATPPPPRTGTSPSTSSPPRASSTTRASTRSERIPSSAGPRRCPRRAPRATGRTVPGASCRATAPTPSPRPLGRSSTSATASASVPASGARHAASARALPRDQPASR